ncbi:MAG: methyltransferase domain-containing protein [Gemmatimonadaceae bacterium]
MDSVQTRPKFTPVPIPPESRKQFEREDWLSTQKDHPNHLFPDIPPGSKVLAIGDGGGWTGQDAGMARFDASDPDPEAITWRKERNPADPSIIGIGEDLSDYPDDTYDFLYARGAIMFMDMPKFFAEADRVTVPGATIWLLYHSWKKTARHFLKSARAGNWKDMIYRVYVYLNGLLFHFTGRLMRFPLNRKRLESFQTKKVLIRELEAHGFTDVRFPATRPGQIPVCVVATKRR